MIETSGFTGSETIYKNAFGMFFTEGVKYVADTAGAYWLVDDISIYQTEPAVEAEEFQVWVLRVDTEKSTGVLTCEDGNGKVVFSKNITFTDYPDPEIKFWCTHRTILLPSEY